MKNRLEWLMIGRLSMHMSIAITIATIILNVLFFKTIFLDGANTFSIFILALFLMVAPLVSIVVLWNNRLNLMLNLRKSKVRLLLLIVFVGFLLDGASTYVFVSLFGLESEANKLAIFISEYFGILGTMLVTTLWATPIIGMLLSLYGKYKHIGKLVLTIGLLKILAGVLNFTFTYIALH